MSEEQRAKRWIQACALLMSIFMIVNLALFVEHARSQEGVSAVNMFFLVGGAWVLMPIVFALSDWEAAVWLLSQPNRFGQSNYDKESRLRILMLAASGFVIFSAVCVWIQYTGKF